MYTFRLQDSHIAFVFASETEANDFYKKVAHRGKYAKGEWFWAGQTGLYPRQEKCHG
jgi:hypothetical protein